MIRYLKHNEIDKAKWDESIANSQGRHPYALSWFLDIVSPGWEALVYGDYQMIMPLTMRRKFGIAYLFQPILCTQLGVYSTAHSEIFTVDDFIKAIPRKFVLADIGFNRLNQIDEIGKGKQLITKYNQYLPLDKPYEILAGQYTKSHLKNIRKFEKKQACKITDDCSYLEFFSEKIRISSMKGVYFPDKEQKFYLNILKTLHQKEKLMIVSGVDEDGKIVGSVCFMFLDFNVVGVQSFCNESGKKNGLIFYIMDQFIKMNAGSNLIIDFMGSSLPGVKERNLGFGSIEITYPFLSMNRLKKYLFSQQAEPI